MKSLSMTTGGGNAVGATKCAVVGADLVVRGAIAESHPVACNEIALAPFEDAAVAAPFV